MNPRFQGHRNSQNNNNKILIGVSVFSLILIVLAIFLLNSTFSNNNRTNTAANNSASTVSSSSRRTGSGFADTSNLSSSSSRRSGSASSGNSSSSSGSSQSGEYNLENNQLVARYLGDGESRNFEIVECKVEEVHFCKPGVKLTYQDGQSREVGKLYKMSGQITDTPESMSLSGMTVTDL